MKKYAGALIPVLLAWLLTACEVDTMSIPQTGNPDTDLGLGADTTWLKLTTSIDLAPGSAVRDVFIDDDGHIYLADSALGEVTVWDQALNNITSQVLPHPIELPGVRSLAVGPEQILFLADSTNKIYGYNLQANRLNILAAYRSMHFRTTDSVEFDIDALGFSELVEGYGLTGEFLTDLVNHNRLGNELTLIGGDTLTAAELDERLEPAVIYEKGSGYYLSTVAGGRAGDRELLVGACRDLGDYLLRVPLVPDVILLTDNIDVPIVYLYHADEEQDEILIYQGSGAGFTFEPNALEMDASGDIYLANLGGLFPVQRLALDTYGGDNWSFDGNLYGSEMVQLGRFEKAPDLTYTNDNVYIVDEVGKSVQVFTLSGDFLYPCGASRKYYDEYYSNRGVLVDTTLYVDGLARDTTVALLDTTFVINSQSVDSTLMFAAELRTIKGWEYDQLSSPKSVAVFGNRSSRTAQYDETVFVADQDSTGSTIYLFQLSVSSDDLPTQ